MAGLRVLPDARGKASLALGWKRLRERRGALDGDWPLRLWDGSVVRLPRGSVMTWAVAATGQWDRHLIEFVSRYVDPGTVALDVGASLGLWSLPLARVARSRRSRLWCFEPSPYNVPRLEANLERNGLHTIAAVRPVALGAQRGAARLGYRERGGGNGALLDVADPDSVEVAVERLDDIEFPLRVSFVKMDVEGFELEVLRGGRALLERDRPVIFGEFSAAWLAMRGEDLDADLAALCTRGYEVFKLEQRRSARWRPNDVASLRRLEPPFASAENLLLLPRPAAG